MKKTTYLALFASLIILFGACDPETDDPNNPNPTTPTTHVYIAANDSYFIGSGPAVYWKDGVKTVLSTNENGTQATSIFVDDNNNIYVGGENNDKPVVWKNGVEQILSTDYGCVNGIIVKNNIVYAVGTIRNDAILWRNGIAETIATGNIYNNYNAIPTNIYIQGNDIYISGYSGNYEQAGTAWIWENGTITNLSENKAQANDLFVSANNVYVVGIEKYVAPNITSHKAVLWTNGIAQDLNIGGLHSDAYAICRSNDTNYIACTGYYGSAYDGYYKGCLWKNNFSSLYNCTSLLDLFVHGSDLYILGYDGDFEKHPVLFKNGVKSVISYSTSWPTAIFVK